MTGKQPDTIILTDDSPLKLYPINSKKLYELGLVNDEDWLKRGHKIEVPLWCESFRWQGLPGKGDDHLAFFWNGCTRYLYAPHCQIEEGVDPKNDPQDPELEPEKPSILPWKKRGSLIEIPGMTGVRMNDPLFPGAHFTWREVTKGEAARLPTTELEVRRVIAFGEYMEKVRSKLGDRPITVTSWLRPPTVNQRVGGARYSQHLKGWACDFKVKGMTVRAVFYALRHWHRYGGLAPGSTFTHIDRPDIDIPGSKPPVRRWFYSGTDKSIELW